MLINLHLFIYYLQFMQVMMIDFGPFFWDRIRQGQENVPPGGRDPLSGMVRRALTQAVRIQHRPSFDPDVQIPKEMALANKRDLLRKVSFVGIHRFTTYL